MLILREAVFTRKKGALTLQLAGCTLTPLSGWTGKQHLYWGWHPCVGVTHSSVFFQSPCPEGLQGSRCWNCANFQYFAHLGIRAVAYFRVALAGHVMPLSQREKVRNSDLLGRMIKSSAWCDTWPVTYSTTAGMGWKCVWVALEGHKCKKKSFTQK